MEKTFDQIYKATHGENKERENKEALCCMKTTAKWNTNSWQILSTLNWIFSRNIQSSFGWAQGQLQVLKRTAEQATKVHTTRAGVYTHSTKIRINSAVLKNPGWTGSQSTHHKGTNLHTHTTKIRINSAALKK